MGRVRLRPRAENKTHQLRVRLVTRNPTSTHEGASSKIFEQDLPMTMRTSAERPLE